MGLNVINKVISEKYTNDTANGLGAIKGSPCTIKTIKNVEGGKEITMEWTGNDGAKQTYSFIVNDGLNGTNGLDGANGLTPVKGIDYWTQSDISEIKDYCLDYINDSILGGSS